MKRVSKFLKEPEVDMNAVGYNPQSEYSVLIEDGSFTWDNDNRVQHLKE